ncbi:flagellar filament capping protein FliD [Acidicapsa ligni]|uniref:flagellar filament capping protein FliD n=1 Tax=Acidicapsa ligni TaxID=542300 RepID=UPI0021DF7B55|nr:flagellar filament capping protein FliD [Acidicapsa ligni]
MGTVGISFGSPTAGTGFDVSNTVSQIVANLQNVESPWKSQLGVLSGQDAAISSLGSLLSTLSNDIGQFTDFDGVLSGKQGSSSDPGVLAITSASTSAVAGTHTIVVNSLAAISSGYLDEIPTADASAALSGSISIRVGSGTAQTITLDSGDNTLAGVASAINAAGIGVTASVLTDTTGSRLSLVSATSGTAGDLSVTSSISDGGTNPLGYNPATAGADASLSVDGVTITSASNTVANVIPGVTFELLAPSPITGTGATATPEPVQMQVINYNTGVVSSMTQLVSDYNAVVSAINSQEGNTSSGTPEPLFGTPTLTLLQEQLLGSINTTSPSGYLDEIPSANTSDTLTGSITITAGSSSPATIDLSSLPTADQNLNGLVSAINSTNIGVTASVLTDSTGSRLSLVSDVSGAAGKLTVTSSIADGATTLNYNPQSDVNSLTALGVTVNNDGTLSLDSDTLNNELNMDYSGVVSFFQNSDSWGTEFSNTLNNLGTSNINGTLALALSSDSSIESSLNTDISNEDLVISTEQVSLTLELTSANEILQSIPSNLNNVSELYSAITGYNAPTLG